MHQFVSELFPLHRSITGDGVRETFEHIQRFADLDVHEVATGTPVLDWEVPQEWRIRDAFIADAISGERLIDLADSNLHVLNYSQPIDQVLDWEELEPHLVTLPDQPDLIPYRTAYFREQWGFCLSENKKLSLRDRRDARLRAVVDCDFFDGSLTYGEVCFPGDSDRTALFYAHTCHPSLANDNLSGIAVATFLAQELARRSRKWTYRIVFAPATIGAITWLSRNESLCPRIDFGLVLSLLGDDGDFTYKLSQQETSLTDRVTSHVLRTSDRRHSLRPFSPFGYDERQFNSPGFDLPVGCLTRTPPGQFSQYHTSADNLDFVSSKSLAESLAVCESIVDVIENNHVPRNLRPHGEPQLGRHGIYSAYGERDDRGQLQEAAMWVLNQANGERDLLSIATRAELPFSIVSEAADLLREHGLIERNSA